MECLSKRKACQAAGKPSNRSQPFVDLCARPLRSLAASSSLASPLSTNLDILSRPFHSSMRLPSNVLADSRSQAWSNGLRDVLQAAEGHALHCIHNPTKPFVQQALLKYSVTGNGSNNDGRFGAWRGGSGAVYLVHCAHRMVPGVLQLALMECVFVVRPKSRFHKGIIWQFSILGSCSFWLHTSCCLDMLQLPLHERCTCGKDWELGS